MVANFDRNVSGSEVLTWAQTLKLTFRGYQIHVWTCLDERNTMAFLDFGISSRKKGIRDKPFCGKRSIFIKEPWIHINYFFTSNRSIGTVVRPIYGISVVFSDS